MRDWKKLYKQEDYREEDFAAARYSKNVMDHFRNPRNVGYIENPDGRGGFGGEDCDDYLEIYIMCNNADDRISEIKWQLFGGCVGLVSTTSAMTELAGGKTLSEALDLKDEDIVSHLGGIPEENRHCTLLCLQALHNAISDYRAKKNRK